MECPKCKSKRIAEFTVKGVLENTIVTQRQFVCRDCKSDLHSPATPDTVLQERHRRKNDTEVPE